MDGYIAIVVFSLDFIRLCCLLLPDLGPRLSYELIQVPIRYYDLWMNFLFIENKRRRKYEG